MSYKKIEVLIAVRGEAGEFSQKTAGGFPDKVQPQWFALDGNTEEELLMKLATNVYAVYYCANNKPKNTTMESFCSCIKKGRELLNKILRGAS